MVNAERGGGSNLKRFQHHVRGDRSVRLRAVHGRWSQRLAPSFVEFAGVQAGERALDVGCGTGSLTLALMAAGVAAAVGVDPSSPYVEFARHRTSGPEVRFDVGNGTALPYGDGEFDRSLSMLVLDVVPDAAPIIAESRSGRASWLTPSAARG